MSNQPPLNADAQELLNGPASQPGAAAPAPQPTAPPPGYAPIAALQGEQAVAKQARESFERMKMSAELNGFQVQDDGTLVQTSRPQPSAPVQPNFPPKIVALATQLGVDPADVYGAMAEAFVPMADTYARPIAGSTADLRVEMHAAKDPDADLYRGSVAKHLAMLPPQLQGTKDGVEFAIERARAEHFDALVERAAERKANPGRVVGRFTEGAQPGTHGESAVALTSEQVALGQSMGLSKETMDRAAQIRAERLQGER